MASLTAEHADNPQIGMLLRNRPGQVAAFLGVLLAGGTVVTINPSRGDERTRADIAALQLPLVVGEPDDLATLVAPATPTLAIAGRLDEPGESARRGYRPIAAPEVAVRMLTSGTTGPPKRIDLSYDMLARSVMGRDPDHAPAPQELRRGVAIMNSPLVHIGGVFRVLQCVAEARSFVLLERFELKRVGSGGAHAPAPRGITGACRIADGVALRPVACRSGQHPRRHLWHGPAVG